jgi:hypothetical protein
VLPGRAATISCATAGDIHVDDLIKTVISDTSGCIFGTICKDKHG